MRKKSLAAIVIALTLILSSCGNKEQKETEPAPSQPSAEAGTQALQEEPQTQNADASAKEEAAEEKAEEKPGIGFEIIRNEEKGTVRVHITAEDPEKKELWSFESEECAEGELEAAQEIAETSGSYLFLCGGTVYCLDTASGELKWKNGEFKGAGASWSIGDDGTLYLCGYYGPDLFAVSSDGKTEARIQSLAKNGENSDCFWACGIRPGNDGTVHVSYDSCDITLSADPATGEIKERYGTALCIEKEKLCGTWSDVLGSGDLLIEIADNMGFDLSYMHGGNLLEYSGRVSVRGSGKQHSGLKSDIVSFELTQTNDPAFEGVSSLGEYSVSYYYDDGKGFVMLTLRQESDGSFFEKYMNEKAPSLFKR